VFILIRLPQLPRPIRLLAMPSALALVALLLAGCGSGSGHSSLPPAAGRVGPESIFEAGPQLASDPAGTLDTLRLLGVDGVKLFVPWSALAPNPSSRTRPRFDASNPAAYSPAAWAPYDAVVRDAAARGIGVDLTLSSPPAWAAGPDAPDPVAHPQWKPSPSEFGSFFRAVGTRYSGSYRPPGSAAPLPRVSFWSIWNEPNYGPDLAPQAIKRSTVEVSPAIYRGLLDAAWSALHQTGHGHDTILIGELAPRGITIGNSPGNFGGMVPLRFLRALYCVDSSLRELRGAAAAERGCPTSAAGSAGFRARHPALFQASGFADHPYPQGDLPPNVPTAAEPDYADLPALPNLERTLDRVQAIYGSSTVFRIYSTEFGYQTNPPEKLVKSTDPVTAAAYLNWAEYISWRDPRVASYDQYLLADSPRANASGGFATGLEFADGAPKATYAAYRLPIFLPVTSFGRGQAVEVWGSVRPARFARLQTGAPQRVQIQYTPGSSGAFSTVRTVTLTDPYGYFDVRQKFDGSGTVRLSWAYPRGPTIFSRAVEVVVR
jgi:hypothetical protein